MTCTVTGTLVDPSGIALAGAPYRISRAGGIVGSGSATIIPKIVTGHSGASGEFSAVLYTGNYALTVWPATGETYAVLIAVPPEATATLADLMDQAQPVSPILAQVLEALALAEAWAEKPEDAAVEPGKFSALHHAAKALGFRDEAAAAAAIAVAIVGSGNGLFPNGTVAAPALSFAADPDTGMFRQGANVLGFATGGALRLRLMSSGAEITGLLSGTAVQLGAIDATAGRLLPVGAFGLGASHGPLADLNSVRRAGFYYAYSDATGAPEAGSANWSVLDLGGFNQNNGVQIAARQNALNTSPLYVARYAGGALGAWYKLHHTGSMLGTVSQAGGVPTGAVIERGSNANGSYVRFADGTQYCWHSLNLGSPVANGTGTRASPFYTGPQDWTLPAAFAAPPKFFPFAGQGAPVPIADRFFAVSNSAASATGITYIRASRLSSGTDATDVTVDVFAVGRWF